MRLYPKENIALWDLLFKKYTVESEILTAINYICEVLIYFAFYGVVFAILFLMFAGFDPVGLFAIIMDIMIIAFAYLLMHIYNPIIPILILIIDFPYLMSAFYAVTSNQEANIIGLIITIGIILFDIALLRLTLTLNEARKAGSIMRAHSNMSILPAIYGYISIFIFFSIAGALIQMKGLGFLLAYYMMGITIALFIIGIYVGFKAIFTRHKYIILNIIGIVLNIIGISFIIYCLFGAPIHK